MWAWIMNELQKAVKALPVNKNLVDIDKDDIVQNAALALLNSPEKAQKIYDTKNIGALYTIVRRGVYGNYGRESKLVFNNKMELSRYQRIMAVCDKHGIEPIPENAYKVSAILENGSNNFTITGVASMLSRNKQKARSKELHKKGKHL